MTPEPGLVRTLYRAAGLPTPDAPADGPLLARFLADRDEAAFAELVRRHGPMVLGVCRRMLGNSPDADDAFQAVFLVLVRRAGGLTGRATVGNFLYGVAVHAGQKARAAAMKRRAKEAVAARLRPTPADPSDWLDVFDAELAKLPDKYRGALVLCELEGVSRRDAAARLGVPDGTLSSRLATAKRLLADRLTRRGVTAPAAGLAVVVPRSLADAAVRTAIGGASATVLSLTNEVVRAMYVTKLTAGTAVVLAAVAVGAGVVLAQGPKTDPAPPPQPAELVHSDFFQKTAAMDRMKRLGLGMHLYLDAVGAFPKDITDKAGKPILSWRVAILPHIGEGYMYSQFKLDEPWDSDHNKKFLWYVPELYRTPGAGPERTRTMVFAGPGTIFEPGKAVKIEDIPDGTVDTLLAVDAGPPMPWTKPADLPFDPKGPLPKLHPPFADGFATSWADGSARWLRPDPDPALLKIVIQRADGELPKPWPFAPGPARPLTEKEQKELAWQKAWFARRRVLQTYQLEERLRLTEALKKLGAPLVPDPPAADAGLWEWTQANQRLRETEQSDLLECSRLWRELEKRNPKAAEKLRKELPGPKEIEKALPPAEAR